MRVPGGSTNRTGTGRAGDRVVLLGGQPVAAQRRVLGAPHPALTVDHRRHRRRSPPSTSSAGEVPTRRPQVGTSVGVERARSAPHTGQANARTGHMVSRCNCFWSDMRYRCAANPVRAPTRTCPSKGIEQAERLPDALARFPISRLVSSPQRRAMQTAQPVADALGLPVDVDERLAEYDRDLLALHADRERPRTGGPAAADRRAAARRASTRTPSSPGSGRASTTSSRPPTHDDTVAVFSHGGVINALVHEIMGTERLLSSRSTTPASPGCCRPASGKLGGRVDQRHRARVGPAAAEPSVVNARANRPSDEW